jgi:peptidyl-prolyl cis-trans isomerase A (cyclophilin A)
MLLFNMNLKKDYKQYSRIIAFFVLSAICFSFSQTQLFSQNIKEIEKLVKLKAPKTFKAKFLTTKGDFEITIERKLSPLAADRMYQLIKANYFTDIPIYRVMKNFVAQFGTVDGALDSALSKYIVIDEPVLKSNETGTLAFARAGKNTRGTQLFINLKNNLKLDTVSYGETIGFPVFGYVSAGMDVVNQFYNGYGDEPRLKLDSVTVNVIEYIKKSYPNLDYIKKAYIIINK